MSRSFPPHRSRPGTTLIEVLLGLVLLSTLLASVAIARGRFLRQWADADKRLKLTHAADALMTQWMSGPADAVPTNGRGTLPDAAGVWRTRVIPDRQAATLGTRIVRLELYAEDGTPPAVSLDVLVPLPQTAASRAGEVP